MSDYVNTIQTSQSGFVPFFTSGYVFATEALANGGAWYDASNPSGIHQSGFLVSMTTSSEPLTGAGGFLTGNLSNITFSKLADGETGKYIIGAVDLRGTGIGYSGLAGAEGSAPLNASTTYQYGAFIELTGAGGVSTISTGALGIGKAFNSGYYTGSATTDDPLRDFPTTFNTGTQTGSGIRFGKDLSLSLQFLDRAGEVVGTPDDLANNPYLDTIDIDVATVPASPITIVQRLETNFQGTTYEFSEALNKSIQFPGEAKNTFTDDYSIVINTTDENGNVSKATCIIYGESAPELISTQVTDGTGTFENSNSANCSPSVPSAPYARDLASHYQLDSNGIEGLIEFRLKFPVGRRHNLSHVNVYAATGQGNSFSLVPANFIGRFDLTNDPNQSITLSRNYGIVADTPYYFALVVVGAGGATSKTNRSGPFTIKSVKQSLQTPLFRYGVPNQTVPGCFTVYDCLNVETKTLSDSTLSVKDSAGVTSATISNADSRGKMTLYDEGGIVRMTSEVDSNKQGMITLKDSSANDSIKLSSDSNKRGVVDIYDAAGASKIEMKADSNDEGMVSIKDSLGNLSTKVQGHKSVISALNSNIYSTGSVIVAGSGHIISGDFDLIAGGATANISGGDYNFIGGGSGIDITHSAYSSSIGGFNNDIITGDYSVIAGGKNNLISGDNSVQDRYNFIGGGLSNKITGVASAAIMGGENNEIRGGNSFIGGGNVNAAHGAYAFIGGGESNTARGEFGAILAGEDNSADGTHAVVAGGNDNLASGNYSFVGGGQLNNASGDYSYAFGRKAEIGKDQDGAAVLADGQNRTHSSSGEHTLTLDFASGVYVPATGFFNALHVSGVPVLTGENNPAEADTLQTVTNRGDTTTNSIEIEGQHLSGVTGVFSRDLSVGSAPVLSASSRNGRVGVGMNGHDVYGGKFGVYGGAMIGASYAPYEAPPSNGLIVEGDLGVGTPNPNSTLDVRGTISGVSGLFSNKVGIGTNAPVSELHVNGAITSNVALNNQTSTSYTLVIGDQGKLLNCDNASAITVTVPPNSSVNFPVGAEVAVAQVGAGQISIAPGAGVSVTGADAEVKTRTKYSSALITQTGSDHWLVVGDVTS